MQFDIEAKSRPKYCAHFGPNQELSSALRAVLIFEAFHPLSLLQLVLGVAHLMISILYIHTVEQLRENQTLIAQHNITLQS